ncbi:MAG: ABC transporter permease [Lachnospiraceae bacterium]|nr:ABC transporter permease [Lachnospiraceae bacterium]
MKSMMKKTTFREIRQSFGRFFAIFAIIALGVGFFAGIKNTTPSMLKTINEYLKKEQLYDYRLISTIGWTSQEVAIFKLLPDVRYAEGSYSYDIIYSHNSKQEMILKTHSIMEHINGVSLVKGEMPKTKNECVIDVRVRDIPKIGEKIRVTTDNSEDTLNALDFEELTVVGYVNSSYYINFERGSTSLGNGSVAGYVYVLPEAFKSNIYTEIFVKFDQDYPIYSEEYSDYMQKKKDTWEAAINLASKWRYLNLAYEAINSSDVPEVTNLPEYKELTELLDYVQNKNISDLANPSEIKLLAESLDAIDIDILLKNYLSSEYANSIRLETFLLERNTNVGYVCFESDSGIVAQVARVFPVFFILVAALVCMTTMSRMVEEQRTQIGIFKALGYSNIKIMNKFMFYSGSAAILGCIFGYSIGIFLFPKVIWKAYELMYIAIPLKYSFDIKLAVISILVALICSIGTTWFSCHVELSETAASLMRPKAPKAGKRIFLEYLPFLWKKLKFLYKVSLRNIFRYKKRFFMMILGIGGCMALLLTGFGLYDSIAGFADMQYDNIETADASLVYLNGEGSKLPDSLQEKIDRTVSDYLIIHEASWDIITADNVKSINLMVPLSYDNISLYLNFHTEDSTPLAPPSKDEALISNGIAKRYNINVGDYITLRDENMRQLKVRISGIYENYVYNFIFLTHETLEEQLEEDTNYNTLYINFPKGTDFYKLSADLMKDGNTARVSLFNDLRNRVAGMMKSLVYVVILVIICAAVLAFIVIYNLTNINITERIREIATIKVLGFFKKETASYVFRENIFLTTIGIIIGIFLGILLHRFVMSQIIIDMVCFRINIKPISFVLSIILTFAFNLLVNLFMNRKLDKINMAESLKSVE